MKHQIKISDITPVPESFSVPEDYFEVFGKKLQAKLRETDPVISIESLQRSGDTFTPPAEYFGTLEATILEKVQVPDNTVSFRSRRIKIWGGMVAAACVALVFITLLRVGTGTPEQPAAYADNSFVKRIPDHEIAALLQDRDDEFRLTDEELMEVVEHETRMSETTAIIHFLEDDADVSGTGDEEFIESI